MTYVAGIEIELNDYLEKEPEIEHECCFCGNGIQKGEDFFNVYGDIVCENCDLDYMKRFREVGA